MSVPRGARLRRLPQPALTLRHPRSPLPHPQQLDLNLAGGRAAPRHPQQNPHWDSPSGSHWGSNGERPVAHRVVQPPEGEVEGPSNAIFARVHEDRAHRAKASRQEALAARIARPRSEDTPRARHQDAFQSDDLLAHAPEDFLPHVHPTRPCANPFWFFCHCGESASRWAIWNGQKHLLALS